VETIPVLIGVAFLLGLCARLVGLPPLVGFLIAGFGLGATGYESSPDLQLVADLGVTLLLFTIGLKLRVRSLLRPEIWAGSIVHMALVVASLTGVFVFLGFGLFASLDLRTAALIAFALSFSSTVFAVKVFEEQGQSSTLFARTAIGLLIMQDIVAVVFLAVSQGKAPTPWAIGLLLLLPGRRALGWLLDRTGHGELLLLLGVMMNFVGWNLFEIVQLKGDLGALVMGMLIADHPKAKEMARSLLGFKDLFLVGFFLTIGLRGVPSASDLGIALFLTALIPVKMALYFGVLTRFRLRARTSLMATLGLANYSEFGLIVGTLGVSAGWLSDQWLLILAVAVALTFVLAAPLNAMSNRIYDCLRETLVRFETEQRKSEEIPVSPGAAEVVIFGMGRVGTGAYGALQEQFGRRVLGVDTDRRVVERHVDAGRNVIPGDPTDVDFWDRFDDTGGRIELVLLALPNHQANLAAAAEMEKLPIRSRFRVAATAKYDDQIPALEAHGVDVAFNLYAEAGQGYADMVMTLTQEGSRARGVRLGTHP
jgi:predicted Kef-type K+ transport protein